MIDVCRIGRSRNRKIPRGPGRRVCFNSEAAALIDGRESLVEHQQHHDTDRHRSISNIEDRETINVITEKVDIEKINIDEINYLSVKERTLTENYAVENPVNQVADGAAKDQGQCQPDDERLLPDLVQIDEDTDARDDGEYSEEELAADIDTERHSRILDEGQTEEIADDGETRPYENALVVEMQEWDLETLDEQLRDLIEQNNESRYVQNTHYR